MSQERSLMMKKLFRFEMLMHRYQAFRFHTYGPYGNPMRGQGRVLSILKMQPQISQRELSYLLDMRQQSLSELLAKLEHAGLITRAASEDDRRAVTVTLTEQGREASSGGEAAEPDDSGLLGCLSDEEQAQLSDMLDRLTLALEEKLESIRGDSGCTGERFHRHKHRRGCGMGRRPGRPPFAPEEDPRSPEPDEL